MAGTLKDDFESLDAELEDVLMESPTLQRVNVWMKKMLHWKWMVVI